MLGVGYTLRTVFLTEISHLEKEYYRQFEYSFLLWKKIKVFNAFFFKWRISWLYALQWFFLLSVSSQDNATAKSKILHQGSLDWIMWTDNMLKQYKKDKSYKEMHKSFSWNRIMQHQTTQNLHFPKKIHTLPGRTTALTTLEIPRS